jgi:hypothetical protein
MWIAVLAELGFEPALFHYKCSASSIVSDMVWAPRLEVRALAHTAGD